MHPYSIEFATMVEQDVYAQIAVLHVAAADLRVRAVESVADTLADLRGLALFGKGWLDGPTFSNKLKPTQTVGEYSELLAQTTARAHEMIESGAYSPDQVSDLKFELSLLRNVLFKPF